MPSEDFPSEDFPSLFRPHFDPDSHTYRWNGQLIPSVTDVLRAAHLQELPPADATTLTLAAWRGTLIHQATECVDTGEPHGVTEPGLAGYIQAYAEFCSTRVFVARPTWSEQPICDPTLQVAGTPDRVGYIGEHLDGAVVDLKTGEPHPAIGIQLAAYRLLLRQNGFRVTRRLSVHLRENGSFKVIEYQDPGEEAVFLAALTLHRWRQRRGIA